MERFWHQTSVLFVTCKPVAPFVTFRVLTPVKVGQRAIEQMETLAFRKQREHVLILDFSDVRPRGAPIAGMQNRPASGPGALMTAIRNIAALRDAGMAPVALCNVCRSLRC